MRNKTKKDKNLDIPVHIAAMGLAYRIFRSVSFNILMLVIGFVAALLSNIIQVQYHKSIHGLNDIRKIEEKVDKLRSLDEEYHKIQEEIRVLLDHVSRTIEQNKIELHKH